MDVNYLESLVILLQLSTIISSKPKHDLACREDHSEYLYYPGDVFLGGLFPIHQRPVISKGILQEPKLTAIGYKLLEAMLYAIDEINSRKNYLNYTLGALAFDTCENPDNALLQSLHFIVFNNLLDDASKVINYRRYATGGKPMETYILAVIGGSQSDVTISVANVLKFLYIPQISYMSSSSQLDDAEKYNYFLRTVPSITKTIDVIIELLRKYNWFYINVVLDSSEQGESNYGVFMEKLSQYSETICVAKDVRLIAYPLDAKDIARRLKTIQDSPASDSIYYVPQVVNSVYAVANALRQLLIQYPMVKWHNTSGEQMRKLLLAQLHQCQFEGFGNEIFTFFDKRDGQPKFTILTFLPYALKWKVLAQYGASTNHSFYYINENISTYIHETVPESVCSKPCNVGQIKRIEWGRSCCWTCVNCSSQQIVTSVVDSNNNYERSFYHAMSAMCQFCNPGYRPNKNQTKCQMLPIKYMSIQEIVAQASVGISSIGLILCLIVSVVCIKNWQTPIVKASGKETSIILFLGIILSYISGELILALPPSTFICNFAIFSVGFCITLTYSAIFARSSRINSIFQVSELQGLRPQKISGPASQLIIISVSCATQLLVLSIICGVSPTSPNLILSDYEANSPYSTIDTRRSVMLSNDGDSNRFVSNITHLIVHGLPNNLMLCFPNFTIKQIITIFIPLILMCLSTVYAYKIRKVPSGFNEARALAFVNYINCICFVTTPVLMYYAQKTTLELVPLSFLLIATATNEFSLLILPKMYIILFRPYKNTRASIMQRLRGLSQVECMEWINEVASRSPPGVFSISRGKVLSPWLKIRELSSKSLGAAIQIKPDHKGNKSLIKTSSNKVADSKCLITEFSCGNSLMMKQFSLNSSAEHVDGDKQVIVRMRPQVVSFVEKHNNDRHEKNSITIEQCKNDTITDTVKNNLRYGSGINHKDDNHTALH
ncbi:unnamed protein product [Heterobilharzia americana]|nr:unnamed protein product [Heterobilharzia americana]